MESDINCLTESSLSHTLLSLGCLIVETCIKLIEIAMMRASVHSTLFLNVSALECLFKA